MLSVTNSIQIIKHLSCQRRSEGFGDFKIGQVIHTLKYADEHVLAKEERYLRA